MKSKNFDAIRKQFGLYAILESVVSEHREITPNEWFNWIVDELPHLKVWVENKNSKKVHRKKTSRAIASYLLDKEIKDDNEADAICMLFFDNQELFMKYKEKE